VKRARFDTEIRSRIDSFVAELADLVRRATLQAVVEAVEAGTGETKPAVPARMPKRGARAGTMVAGESSTPAVRARKTTKVPSLEDYESAAIQRALVEANGNVVSAGKLLGKAKSQIYRRARFLGVSNRGDLVRPRLGSNLALDLDAYERAAYEGALNACGRNKVDAAKLLGVGKSTLYRRAEALGIRG
jgi:DNA-binding NtrC family response regulator